MTDPCWLPSAIMQTTGAVIGIYSVVYILVADKLGEAAPSSRPKPFGKNLKDVDEIFLGMVALGLTVIAVNALWLDALSTHLLFNERVKDPFGYIACFLFIFVFLPMIFGYTLSLVRSYRKYLRRIR